MSTRSRFLARLLAAFILLGLLTRPGSAWACSCIYPPQPQQAYTGATAVFSGRVSGINNPSQIPLLAQLASNWAAWTNSPMPYAYYNQRVTFAVHDSWKGVTTASVTVETGQGGGDCGYTFALGQQYVVYAYNYQGTGLETNICTRTSDVANAAADLTYLNTLPRLSLAPVSSTAWPYYVGALILGLFALGGLVWIIRRRTAAKA